MIIFLTILIGVLVILVISLFYLLYRNDEVYKERQHISNKVSDLAKIDIIGSRNWEWRYKEYNKISYEEMLYKFWIPVKDFYKDNKCLFSVDNN